MMFYLKTMTLSKFLTEEAPKLQEGESNLQLVIVVEAWKHSDYLCRNYILNELSDALFLVYRTLPTAKSIWDASEYKYILQDARIKKFIVKKFIDFKMIDGKSIGSQVQELEVIFSGIHDERMVISESFQVAVIIEKLPSGWKDFKNYLKHEQKEMIVKEVALCLRIEEDNRMEMTTDANGPKLVTEA
ncbi:hypothetical protein LIER_29236 [Lithospermum erythrorhizon]|uniref:Uncharacterized protein n=1 Tax=Lithospermum erythrorhizon TaxID=34254 RepID=A0AAV3RJI0_LITER